jgi:hypothetical protein
LAHHRRDRVGVTDVALQPGRREIIRRRSLVVRRGDLSPCFGENSYGGRADAGRRAGHQDSSASQWLRHI